MRPTTCARRSLTRAVVLSHAFAVSSLLSTACHHDTAADQSRAAATSSQPSDLDRPIGYWRSGNTGEALQALRATNWSNPRSEFSSPALRMSEQQFAALPRADKDRTRDQAIALSNDIRALCRGAISEAATLSELGNRADAASLLRGVEGLGARLAEPGRHISIFQTVGESIRMHAQERLALLN